MHSPTGTMRGRSVKEFEEQLTTLRKENFNLKLRIYFLEERMGTNFNLDKENAVKQNIELLVSIKFLQKFPPFIHCFKIPWSYSYRCI